MSSEVYEGLAINWQYQNDAFAKFVDSSKMYTLLKSHSVLKKEMNHFFLQI